MITKELLEYIKRHQELRTPSEEINANLAKQGWTPADIQEATASLQKTKSLEEPKGCLEQAFQVIKVLVLMILTLLVVGFGACWLIVNTLT
jgi:hypothetical protein